MARGSIIKRCPVCRRKEGRTPNHVCSTDVSFYIIYRVGSKQKWEFGGTTKKEAEKKLTQRLSEIHSGTFIDANRYRFSDVSEKWLSQAESRVKASTMRSYRTDVNRHLNPFFGHHFIKNIHEELVEEFVSKTRDAFGPKTVNNLRTTLYGIMDFARRRRYININPVEDVKPLKVDHEEMDFLNPQEIRLLLQHAHEPFKTLLLTAIMTGMRRAEILALQWGDIDWNSNTIFIRRSIYWHRGRDIEPDKRGWEFVSPKTERSTRAIVLSPKLKESLEIHRLTSPSNTYDLVFANKEGGPIDPSHLIQRDFLPTLSCAGIRRIRWHDLRHTYTSLLIAQGENLKFIQSQLGHASIQTTIDRYGHLLPVNNVAVGSRFDNQLFGEKLSNTCLTEQAQPALASV